MNEVLANRTLEYVRVIADGTKAANDAADKTVAGMGEFFADKAKEIADTIYARAEAADQTLGSRALQIAETLDTRVARIDNIVSGKLETIVGSIETKGMAVTNALSAKVEGVSETMRKDAAEVERLLNQVAGQVSDTLSAKVQGVTQNLRSEAAEVEGSLNNLATGMEKTLTSLATGMEKTLTGLVEQVAKTMSTRASEVSAAHETLKSDVTGVLERLREANGMLLDVLEGVKNNLGPIEGKVAEKISAFHTALESATKDAGGAIDRIGGQLRDLRETSGAFLRDTSTLTQRFEDQGKAIAATADNLDLTHRKIDATLTERREAIEQISAVLANRAADLEDRLTRFNKLLQESLGAAENPRARNRQGRRRQLRPIDPGDRAPVRAPARHHRRGARPHHRRAAADLRHRAGRGELAVPRHQHALRRSRARAA